MNGLRLLRTGLLLVAVVGTVLGCPPTPGLASDPQRLPQALAALSDPPTDPPTPVPTAVAEAANGGGAAHPPGGGGGRGENDGVVNRGVMIRRAQLAAREQARRQELARFNRMFQLSPELRAAGVHFETRDGTYDEVVTALTQYYLRKCQRLMQEQNSTDRVRVMVPRIRIVRSSPNSGRELFFTEEFINPSLAPVFVFELANNAPHNALLLGNGTKISFEITDNGQLIVHMYFKNANVVGATADAPSFNTLETLLMFFYGVELNNSGIISSLTGLSQDPDRDVFAGFFDFDNRIFRTPVVLVGPQ